MQFVSWVCWISWYGAPNLKNWPPLPTAGPNRHCEEGQWNKLLVGSLAFSPGEKKAGGTCPISLCKLYQSKTITFFSGVVGEWVRGQRTTLLVLFAILGYFSDEVSLDHPPTYVFLLARIIGMYYHAGLCWDGVLLTFFPGWSQTTILPICWVAGIIGIAPGLACFMAFGY
jgi:hypothetical protein